LGRSEFEFSGGSIRLSVLGNVLNEFIVLSGEGFGLEKFGSFWGLVGKGSNGKGGGGSESGNSGLGSHGV
jgi:hypothetical protein